MRKKIALFIIIGALFAGMYACSNQEERTLGSESETETIMEKSGETARVSEPNILQIKSICELATLECYYHNVAKSVKEKGTGFTHIGEKEREFWIEYSGVAKFGVDVSGVSMKINGYNIEITIPKAKLLGLSDYSFMEDSYISSDDGINKNPITAENQTEAVASAEEDVWQKFANDNTMLLRAQDNAQRLIENYINQLGEISGRNYQITWNYK